MPKGVYERTPEMKTGKYERTPEHCAALSVSLTGRTLPPETCAAMSNMATERHAKEMNPLPEGQSITIPKNKNCGSYLGCITEELLALTFKDVKRMPFGNKGFDLICNRDFKIDIKSSATGYKGYWLFNIMKTP